jgi:predicted amidohydrolase
MNVVWEAWVAPGTTPARVVVEAKLAAQMSLERRTLCQPCHVAIMELVEGEVSFVDTRNNTRTGRAYLKPVQTVTAGIPFGRPYNAPFTVR